MQQGTCMLDCRGKVPGSISACGSNRYHDWLNWRWCCTTYACALILWLVLMSLLLFSLHSHLQVYLSRNLMGPRQSSGKHAQLPALLLAKSTRRQLQRKQPLAKSTRSQLQRKQPACIHILPTYLRSNYSACLFCSSPADVSLHADNIYDYWTIRIVHFDVFFFAMLLL